MTREIRTLIEPNDVTAVEFECLHCRARISLDIKDYEQADIKCSQCKRPWFPSLGGPAHAAAHRLLSGLKSWDEVKNNPDMEVGVRIRLQLKPDRAE